MVTCTMHSVRIHGEYMAHTWRTHGAHMAQTYSPVSIQTRSFGNRPSDQSCICQRYRGCRNLLVFYMFKINTIPFMFVLLKRKMRMSLVRILRSRYYVPQSILPRHQLPISLSHTRFSLPCDRRSEATSPPSKSTLLPKRIWRERWQVS